jgi:hypothetical protein
MSKTNLVEVIEARREEIIKKMFEAKRNAIESSSSGFRYVVEVHEDGEIEGYQIGQHTQSEGNWKGESLYVASFPCCRLEPTSDDELSYLKGIAEDNNIEIPVSDYTSEWEYAFEYMVRNYPDFYAKAIEEAFEESCKAEMETTDFEEILDLCVEELKREQEY